MLCLENGLSVIAEPKPSRGSYGTWMGEDKTPTVRGQLESMIDAALGHDCKDFDSFLSDIKAMGVEVKRGKHLAFKIPHGKRFVRCDSLRADYSEAAIMERISGKRIVTPRQRRRQNPNQICLLTFKRKCRKSTLPDLNVGQRFSISKRWQRRSCTVIQRIKTAKGSEIK